jgi:hypothetical protein
MQQQERKQKMDRQHSMGATKSRDACKNSEASNSMGGGQQQQKQQEHHSVNSRRETLDNKAARNKRYLPKSRQKNREKFEKKDVKKSKNSPFFVR